jgi:hypothetical protein
VVPERTRDLFARLCATGQVTEYSEYDGAGHQDIGTASAAQVTAWVADRFADEAPTDSCPESEPPPPEEESTATTSTPTTTAAPLAQAADVSQVSASPRFTG